MPQKEKSTSTNKALMAVGDGVLGAAILITLGVYSGHYLDQKFMTTPWFSIILSLLGGGLGLARLVMKAINLDKDEEEN